MVTAGAGGRRCGWWALPVRGTQSGRNQGDLPVACEDLHYDLEVGLAQASLQGVQLERNGPRIEGARGFQLGLEPLTCGSSSQCGAAVLDITPDHRGPVVAGQHPIAAMQQVIQGVQAWPELPVLAGHEHAVDLRVQAGDVIDGGAFNL